MVKKLVVMSAKGLADSPMGLWEPAPLVELVITVPRVGFQHDEKFTPILRLLVDNSALTGATSVEMRNISLAARLLHEIEQYTQHSPNDVIYDAYKITHVCSPEFASSIVSQFLEQHIYSSMDDTILSVLATTDHGFEWLTDYLCLDTHFNLERLSTRKFLGALAEASAELEEILGATDTTTVVEDAVAACSGEDDEALWGDQLWYTRVLADISVCFNKVGKSVIKEFSMAPAKEEAAQFPAGAPKEQPCAGGCQGCPGAFGTFIFKA